MSLKNSNTTADYIEWDTMVDLVHRLYDDKMYRMSLLVGCGSFFGLRISDLKSLRWRDLLSGPRLSIIEKKTGKRREIKINTSFQRHIQRCYKSLDIKCMDEHCFLSQRGVVISTQMINRHLKSIKARYNLDIEHFSSHSLRKTFGRKVIDSAGEHSEMALIKLSEIFNHSSPMITRRYLGLRAEELEDVYNSLYF
ncbi:MAG: tyrosine-type recombinase/integrase [Alistipes sp.]|nr:tyrosine-type recombinase/integrase [Alistipes sp.]